MFIYFNDIVVILKQINYLLSYLLQWEWPHKLIVYF